MGDQWGALCTEYPPVLYKYQHTTFPTTCFPPPRSHPFTHITTHPSSTLVSMQTPFPPLSTFNVIMCMALSPHILHVGTYSSNPLSFPTPIVLHVLHMPLPTPINSILGHGKILQHMGPPSQVPLATTMKATVNQHPH